MFSKVDDNVQTVKTGGQLRRVIRFSASAANQDGAAHRKAVLKVDRSFVWQTPDGCGAGVLASLSQLSSHLELHALGEGVETAAHEAYLRDRGYRYAQGFYYAEPMAAADFEAWSGWAAE
jgi:EAL domain-containing protein (putative c-di-GMP-specific phosphodiesterase class I)